MPGSNAGNASSTTMMRLSVDVVSTTTAPIDAWTSPRRTTDSHPNDGFERSSMRLSHEPRKAKR